MEPLGMSYQEFLQVCDLLEGILVERFFTGTDFRTLLAQRLREQSPALALKIEGFDDEQIEFLRTQVVEHQKLVKWMNA